MKELKLRNLFSAVVCKRNYSNFEYLCLECYQNFSANWEYKMSNYYYRGNRLNCVFCGKKHDENIFYVEKNTIYPISLNIKVKVFSEKIILNIVSRVVIFNDNLYEKNFCLLVENFVFDLKNKKTYFNQLVSYQKKKTYSCIDINEETQYWIACNSVLRVLINSSLEYKNQELTVLIRYFRNAIEKKLEIKNTYVNGKGSNEGLFLRQIFNLANILGTGRTLPKKFKIHKNDYVPVVNSLELSRSVAINRRIYSVLKKCSQGLDVTTALIKTYDLRNCKSIREILQHNDKMNLIELIQSVEKFTRNIDYTNRLVKASLKNIDVEYALKCKLVNDMLKYYDLSAVVNLVEKSNIYRLFDLERMYRNLSENAKNELWGKHPRVRCLHDCLMFISYKDKNIVKNIKLPRTHVLKRMEMQKDLVRFFIPKTTKELFTAGLELKNCVSSYADELNSQHNIVLMADNNGKLIACIEINKKKIVQAKLWGNKPVYLNSKIQGEILEWAQENGFKIGTQDINKVSEMSEMA